MASLTPVLAYERIHADAAGESHFGPVAIETVPRQFAPPAPAFNVSAFGQASRYGFLLLPCGWRGELHPSPIRMWIVLLSSEMEFEASDGQRRSLGAGSALLLEDVTGKGHLSRVTGNAAASMLVVEV
ncbi:cupin domain-containing protein [Cupriavidus basilensis]|jgi:hypothetical protein|uniref:hypothetical protein n=1 Tax=Cupriavidus TaxID=106589 RepID=UPI00056D475E|nr:MULTISPECIES: hypothetical protein [Cupriavidus]MDF3887253.1 cupin domain-containing protein [Cupriavidus basilensis]